MSNKQAETHVRLLESARSLLIRDGVDVRLEDIASHAGVSRQAVYLHFGSRSGLFVELADYLDQIAGVNDLASVIEEAPDARTALYAVVSQRAKYIPIIYPVAGLLLSARKADSAADAAYNDRQATRRKEYSLLIDRIQSEGSLVPGWDAATAVETVRSVLSIGSWELLVIEAGWSSEKYEKTMREVLERALFVR